MTKYKGKIPVKIMSVLFHKCVVMQKGEEYKVALDP